MVSTHLKNIRKSSPNRGESKKYLSCHHLGYYSESIIINTHMGVSKNRGGPPKSSILIGFSLIFTIHFGGFPPIFGLTPTSKGPVHSETNQHETLHKWRLSACQKFPFKKGMWAREKFLKKGMWAIGSFSTPWSLGMGNLQPLMMRILWWVFINPYGIGLMSLSPIIWKYREFRP